MQAMDELRKRQKAITGDFKSRAEKAEKILGEIEHSENTIALLNDLLSDVLGIGVKTATVVAKVQQAKSAKVKPAKAAKIATVKPAVKRTAGLSLKDRVRDFLVKAGKPMRIAEIVTAMQKAGHVFQSRKPIKAMTKLMYNNSKVFKRVRPGTFKAV